MTDRKWESINVYFNDGHNITIHRRDFDKMKEIAPVLETLIHVKRMQHDVNRLLGEAEDL